MQARSPIRVAIPALALALAGLGLACTVEDASGVLSVTNRSDETIYIRFDTEPDQVVVYRVDPGATGRAQNIDPARQPDLLTIYAGDCREISQQSDPALGQLVIDVGSSVFTAAADPEVQAKPLLPVDRRCG